MLIKKPKVDTWAFVILSRFTPYDQLLGILVLQDVVVSVGSDFIRSQAFLVIEDLRSDHEFIRPGFGNKRLDLTEHLGPGSRR